MLTTSDKRISAEQARTHPWFQKAKQMESGMSPEEHKVKNDVMHRALENFRTFNGKNKAKQAALGFLVQHFMNVSDVI
jgi:hypothetical protein